MCWVILVGLLELYGHVVPWMLRRPRVWGSKNWLTKDVTDICRGSMARAAAGAGRVDQGSCGGITNQLECLDIAQQRHSPSTSDSRVPHLFSKHLQISKWIFFILLYSWLFKSLFYLSLSEKIAHVDSLVLSLSENYPVGVEFLYLCLFYLLYCGESVQWALRCSSGVSALYIGEFGYF